MKTPDQSASWRQPVHTLYGGAHLFRSDTVQRMGLLAVRQLLEVAEDGFALAHALRLEEAASLPATESGRMSLLRRFTKRGVASRRAHPPAWFTYVLHQRILKKLRDHAVEDFRVDFEDGYGVRSDRDEDADAVRCAAAAAEALAQNGLPPFFGLRVRPLTPDTAPRAIRTLDLFIEGLMERTSGLLPSGFVVTLPKVATAREVELLADHLDEIEERSGLSEGAIRVELMVEDPRVLVSDGDGTVVRSLIRAGRGRVRGLHLGLYDYLSSIGVVSSMQAFDHPSLDYLRACTSAVAAAEGVWISDGAVNTIPVGPHRSGKLTKRQREENVAAVTDGWRIVYQSVLHSLRFGYYQGWDLHPSQLVPRYAAVFSLFLREFDGALHRLSSFLDESARARRDGQVFDDVATGRGLLQFFARGYVCGALSEKDVLRTGLSVDEVVSGSFAGILGGRSAGEKQKGAPKGPRS